MEINVEEAEKRMFPKGKIGDVVYNSDWNELCMITACEPQPHEHKEGEPHEHVYLPTEVRTEFRIFGIYPEHLDALVPLTQAGEIFRNKVEEQKRKEQSNQ